MLTPDYLLDAFTTYVTSDIDCRLVEGTNKISCLTPLIYPNGDGVSVWVEEHLDGSLLVTDFGFGHAQLITGPPQDAKAMLDVAERVANDHDVVLRGGSVSTRASLDAVADAIWRVASASAQIADVWSFREPARRERRPESEFTRIVADAVRERNVEVVREEKVQGASGHVHRATIYIPRSETIVEPVGAHGHWNQIAAVYTKFGDLSQANGYRFFSVVDDRERMPDEETTRVLVQVSGVVNWSRRDEWIGALIPT